MVSSFFNLSTLAANWKSGLTVALISIPLSISLAVASGVSPVVGIITAIWAGLIGALFGGSHYNIIGPTGALSGIVAAYALLHGPEQIPALAITAGIFILCAYLCRLERYLIFIPSSVIHGFILGVACIISLNQLNFALGLQNITKHEKFIENVIESLQHSGQSSLPVCALFIIFFLALVIFRKIIPTIPGAIILSPLGIAIGYATTRGLLPFHVETLGSKFGAIEPHLMQMTSFVGGKHIIMPALLVAIVAIIETMLSAKIADTMTRTKHNARKEILGLGFANIISGLVGGMPATAALARTALNIKAGATSNISAVLNSIFIVVGSFLFLAYFSFMPMAVIAAILVYVAINMVEREHFYRLFQHDKGNFIIALFVAAITVYEDPIIGILSGTVMALLLLVKELAQSYSEITVHESTAARDITDAQKKNILVYAFKGKLVYLNNQAHMIRFQSDFTQYAGIILMLNDVYFIDLDGVDALEEIIELIQNRNQMIMLVHPNRHIENMLHNSKRFNELEDEGLVFDSLHSALHFFDTYSSGS